MRGQAGEEIAISSAGWRHRLTPQSLGRLGIHFVAAVVIAACGWAIWAADRSVSNAVGLAARTVCTPVFVQGRELDKVFAHEVAPLLPGGLSGLFSLEKVTEADKSGIRVGLLWHETFALYRPNLGCTVLAEDRVQLHQIETIAPELRINNKDVLGWNEPLSGRHAQIARDLRPVLDRAITGEIENRGLVVLVDGKLVGESYRTDSHFSWTRDTPQLGWSMTKSLVHAMIGRMVALGALHPDMRTGIAAFNGDGRVHITLNDLLTMRSGLKFREEYNILGDVVQMLFSEVDVPGYASRFNLGYKPGTRWYYSSADTNLLGAVIDAHKVAGQKGSNFQFMQDILTGPLGLSSMFVEEDSLRVMVGSSFGYASPRDWAKLGQLYLQDGMWDGTQLLESSWTQSASVPTPDSDGYGSGWWLNTPHRDGTRQFERLPEDMYWMGGFNGQHVVVIPSLNAVVARLAHVQGEDNFEQLLVDIYQTIAAVE